MKCAALLTLALGAAPPQVAPVDASQQLTELHARIKTARGAKDWKASRVAADELGSFVHGSPNGLLERARAEMATGDRAAAVASIRAFAKLGQSVDLAKVSPELAPLAEAPELAEARQEMAATEQPVSLGVLVTTIPDAELLPEDLDYDAAGQRFLVTSVRERKVVSLDGAGHLAPFADPPDAWPLLGLKIDAAHGLVWVTEAALAGFASLPAADQGRSALVAFDLQTGKVRRRVEAPRPSALGDLAVTRNGDVIATDGEQGGVYLLTAGAHELTRLDRGDFVSPQTPAVLADGRVVIPDYVRGLALLDLATGNVTWLGSEGRYAQHGIDGVYWDGKRLLAVQNGSAPERVVAWGFDATAMHLTSETAIERSTPTLGDPTHGVIVGPDFFYLANSGWDVTGADGHVRAGAHSTAARLMKVPLQP